jgi:drug/metabolite transporter (DMT)-like permease
MTPAQLLQLIFLAALWGGSFLFLRVGVAEFGVAPLIVLRVGIGALFLIGLARVRRVPLLATLKRLALPLFVVGVLNSALPFCLFAYAEHTLSAGITSVMNATTPLWGAVIAYLWLGERLAPTRVLGLAIGFAGVLLLVWHQVMAPSAGVSSASTAIAAAAALAAAGSYGVAASYTKRHLTGVDPLINATGTMIAGTIALVPFAATSWPAAPVSMQAWGAVIALGLICTGLAYYLFFRLVAQVGPIHTISVTFVIPVFGILWGALFLGEQVSPSLVVGSAIVLLGTALATGAIKRVPGFARAV